MTSTEAHAGSRAARPGRILLGRQLWLLGVLLFAFAMTGGRLQAQATVPPDPVDVVTAQEGVIIRWRNPSAGQRNASPDWADWPTVQIQGLSLPARLITVEMTGEMGRGQPPKLEIRHLTSRLSPQRSRWIDQVDPPIPQRVDGEPRPALAQPLRRAVPDAPVILLRQGRMRGVDLAVLALLPVYQAEDGLREVQELSVFVPGARLIQDPQELLSSAWSQSPAQTIPAALPGPNADANREAWTIQVASQGIQEISGAALAEAGLDLASLDPAMIHLHHQGAEVALEERGTGDGRLDPQDSLRFYAPTPGDRWNATDTYWLTVESTPGPRMAQDSPGDDPAGARSDGLEEGAWRPRTLYDSTQPGPDGDHWFAMEMRTGPDSPPMTTTITLDGVLSPLASPAIFTLTGSAFTSGQHTLLVEGLEGSAPFSQTLTWSGTGSWSQTFTGSGDVTSLRLILQPGSAPDGIVLDSLTWQRPVRLQMAGRGAFFATPAGGSLFRLTELPETFTLYDVTDPTQPVVVARSPQSGDLLLVTDGTQRRYLLATPLRQIFLPLVQAAGTRARLTAGPVESQASAAAGSSLAQTLHRPSVQAHQAVDLVSPLDAQVLYIGPSQFHPGLAPLVSWRRSQGYSVAVVDVQAIYDAWSYGQVSPEAIRSFLRHAAATWSTPPIAVTLVGDGTSDPHNYLGRNNTNFVPPYLANVDPWLKETACETCFVQLDGDDPLDDPLPDLFVGRFPVKSTQELDVVVAKLLAYEQSPLAPGWQSRAVYVTDNYHAPDGTVDGAGDFPASAEASIALLPNGMEIERVYYDPYPPSYQRAPWREPDAEKAHEKTVAALDRGAGLATYIGHAHFWQWASTDLEADPPYLLGLFDVDTLTNGSKLPIVTELTCLTGMFQQPAYSGTTLDERLFLQEGGGAAAVWGPTGLGVAYGHDTLQAGFYKALWADDPVSKPLGQLTQAGYLEVFADGLCCQENLRTYALFGDPLTVPRVVAPKTVYLPLLAR